MRVISGKYRGKKLQQPDSKDIRPTMDRFKETMFNIISHRYSNNLVNKNVLDVFAGSGAFGIECLSRGAGQVVFMDKNKQAIELIKSNTKNLTEQDQIAILQEDSTKVNLKKLNMNFSLVFLDPPYDSNLIEDSLRNLIKQDIFCDNCLILTESNKAKPLDSLHLVLAKAIGESYIHIYEIR